MKTNLSTFPKPWNKKYNNQKNYEEIYLSDIERWEEDFKAELQKKRLDFQKEWDDIGLICADLKVELLDEILGTSSNADKKKERI